MIEKVADDGMGNDTANGEQKKDETCYGRYFGGNGDKSKKKQKTSKNKKGKSKTDSDGDVELQTLDTNGQDGSGRASGTQFVFENMDEIQLIIESEQPSLKKKIRKRNK